MASDGLLAISLASAREHQRMVLSRQRAVLSLSDCLTLSMKCIYMVSAATQVSLLRKHGSHSSTQLFSLSLVEPSGSFQATFQWPNYVQLAK